MDVNAKTALLGGLSPARFMQKHWQKKPLLVRQACPGVAPPLARTALFNLAANADVESRLVQREGAAWRVRSGPLARRALPSLSRPGWTLLVQGLDLHVNAAHDMLQRFRFAPDARLDDLMVSWASDGGGVGPHVDAYDVFLLQVQGRRRWQVGRVKQPAWIEGAPLKLLRHFEPTQEWLLEPGDMLYLPPQWGHEGTAVGGDCMTCSIGFSAPAAGSLARELLSRLADEEDSSRAALALYRDARQPATQRPAAVPSELQDFARAALQRHLADPEALPRVLGAWLTEPKPRVWFGAAASAARSNGAVRLDPRTRMMYDDRHVFINGEALRASGRDARAMRQLADARALSAPERGRLSPAANEVLAGWIAAGWAHGANG